MFRREAGSSLLKPAEKPDLGGWGNPDLIALRSSLIKGAGMGINIALQRLYNQRIEGQKFQTAAEVVGWLGAVQAQEYLHARWALGLRMEKATEAAVEQAFNDGAILRTHVMRPTWHFVTPADIRWILELTAPRVHTVSGTMYRQLELDDKLLARSCEVIVRSLEGGKHLTRVELGAALTASGIDTSNGMRLGYIMSYAELERIVCSGARRGKQHTYALIDERAPQARRLARDEALAELTLRFFTSHGPARIKDFAWWSGLTVADVKAGLAMLGTQLAREEFDGQEYWFSPSLSEAKPSPRRGYLLPPYDEYGIAYKDHHATLPPDFVEQVKNGVYGGMTLIDLKMVGYWRRTISKKATAIESGPFRPFSADDHAAMADAAQRYSAFLEMPVTIHSV
jgi:hypothetical protein